MSPCTAINAGNAEHEFALRYRKDRQNMGLTGGKVFGSILRETMLPEASISKYFLLKACTYRVVNTKRKGGGAGLCLGSLKKRRKVLMPNRRKAKDEIVIYDSWFVECSHKRRTRCNGCPSQ